VVDAVLPLRFGRAVAGWVTEDSRLGPGLVLLVDVHAATRSADTAGSSSRRTAYL
jgi:hypothetical protein